VLALFGFIWRAWRPYDAVLRRVDGLKGYHDVTRYPQARRIPGLVLFRWDAPLFLPALTFFVSMSYEQLPMHPRRPSGVSSPRSQ
jgi:MFS superfamily sulfate permease-like transporter